MADLTYVVVVNWNGKEVLKKCLSSFFNNTKNSNCKVIVVDNASTDGSPEMVQNNFSQVKLIMNSHNVGFSKANNQGIRHALDKGANYILLLNNDVEIPKADWFEDLTGVLESDTQIGVAGCKLIYPDGIIQHAGGIVDLRVPHHRGEGEKDLGQFDRIEFVDYVTGAALMIKTDVIRKIGLLDEGFSPLYFEDTDWCLRARFFGFKVIYTPNPKLIHYCGASSNKLNSDKKRFYSRKNFIRFTLLNYQVKDILKRTLLFESKELVRCLIVRGQRKLPFTLRSDASSKLWFFARVWWDSIRDIKGILTLRRQRLVCGAKLRL